MSFSHSYLTESHRLVSLRDAHNKVIALAALEDENRAKEVC